MVPGRQTGSVGQYMGSRYTLVCQIAHRSFAEPAYASRAPTGSRACLASDTCSHDALGRGFEGREVWRDQRKGPRRSIARAGLASSVRSDQRGPHHASWRECGRDAWKRDAGSMGLDRLDKSVHDAGRGSSSRSDHAPALREPARWWAYHIVGVGVNERGLGDGEDWNSPSLLALYL
ncbi:hypothetical protein BD413DRAFT_522746 [Trametes elegans]|nr:hypothetical protein BD413DRAFT_522746 [Trametes elegans]